LSSKQTNLILAFTPARGSQPVFPVFTIAKYNRCKTKILQGAEKDTPWEERNCFLKDVAPSLEAGSEQPLYVFVCESKMKHSPSPSRGFRLFFQVSQSEGIIDIMTHFLFYTFLTLLLVSLVFTSCLLIFYNKERDNLIVSGILTYFVALCLFTLNLFTLIF
jgi:hypothetical protein